MLYPASWWIINVKTFVEHRRIFSFKTIVIHPGLAAIDCCLGIWKPGRKEKNHDHGTGVACLTQRESRGFTLIELMTIIVIIGSLSTLAIPTYSYYIEKAKVTETIAELRMVEKEVIIFFNNNDRYPNNLAEIGQGGLLDPWGNPYRYLDVTTAVGLGQCRSNKFNNPINSDFDLFSPGRDGGFARPVTADLSRDDILRADNGRFLGLAADL